MVKIIKNKLLSFSEVVKQLEQARDKTIVFTGGVFDLFHYGHLIYLQECASLGEVLVVLIPSDASVKKRKGNSRPIFTAEHRASIVSALDVVDFVFIEDKSMYNPELVSKIKPNIFCSIDENKNTEDNRSVFEKLLPDMEFKVLSPKTADTQGISTTRIIEKIKST